MVLRLGALAQDEVAQAPQLKVASRAGDVGLGVEECNRGRSQSKQLIGKKRGTRVMKSCSDDAENVAPYIM